MELPQRKQNRLKNFDYSSNAMYFITICTENKKHIFGSVVGETSGLPPQIHLSAYGETVKQGIEHIHTHYPTVFVEKYVIMPNHIHLLLLIDTYNNGRPMVAPTISVVVQQIKGYISKQLGFSPWQKSFHDHIIRNEQDYEKIWEYIDTNIIKWKEDCFYSD